MSRVRRELLAYLDTVTALWPGGTGARIRLWWISRRLADFGSGSAVDERVKFIAPERMHFGSGIVIGSNGFFAAAGGGVIIVGDGVGFNTNVHINACTGGTIRIGNRSMLGPNVVLRTAGHRFERTDIPMQAQG